MFGLKTGRLVVISGENVGLSTYASNKASRDGLLGVFVDNGDADSYIIDLVGLNITDQGSDITIYWEDITGDNLIPVDTENSYDSYAPYTDGNHAIYTYYNVDNYDINIYNIDEQRIIYFAGSSNNEILTDFSGTVIAYCSNINSFTHNNDSTDDYDIYRSQSDTEYIGDSIISAVPFIIIFMVIAVILGAFKMFGNEGFSSGGMI
jgi:hypothetical protein